MAKEVKAKYDYNSGHEDDLSFNVGQTIVVTEEVDEEWFNGQYIDSEGHLRRGMFPRNFVTIPPKPSSALPPPAAKQDTAKDATNKLKQGDVPVGSPSMAKKQGSNAAQDATAKSASPPLPPATGLKKESRASVRETESSRQRVSRSPVPVLVIYLRLGIRTIRGNRSPKLLVKSRHLFVTG